MLHVYINYPNPHATIHRDSDCKRIRQADVQGQRVARINLSTLSKELSKFANKDYRFAPRALLNDIWVEIDFGDAEKETAIAAQILNLVGKHYTPFRRVKLETHC